MRDHHFDVVLPAANRIYTETKDLLSRAHLEPEYNIEKSSLVEAVKNLSQLTETQAIKSL